MKRLSSEAVAVLGLMETDGNLARIVGGQLERKLYVEINAALEAIGGKWNRRHAAHVFAGDPRDAIDAVVFSGGFTDRRVELQFFETPQPVVERMMALAEIGAGMRVLEPSAGHGAIADTIARYAGVYLRCVEIDAEKVARLVAKGHSVHCADFLAWRGEVTPFDRVVMNPPFTRQQDIDHIVRAWDFVAPGGRLFAVASAGVRFRDNRKTVAFRELVEAYGHIEELPPQSFRSSGTDVATVLVIMERR